MHLRRTVVSEEAGACGVHHAFCSLAVYIPVGCDPGY